MTRTQIIEAFQRTPLSVVTATPAPNDHMELGNHAEFSALEMLRYVLHARRRRYVRLAREGHAEGAFWSWVCSWAVTLRTPADLGYDDAGSLPRRYTHHHVVEVGTPEALLFPVDALQLAGAAAAWRAWPSAWRPAPRW